MPETPEIPEMSREQHAQLDALIRQARPMLAGGGYWWFNATEYSTDDPCVGIGFNRQKFALAAYHVLRAEGHAVHINPRYDDPGGFSYHTVVIEDLGWPDWAPWEGIKPKDFWL